MKNYTWTEKELKLFEEWDWIMSFIDAHQYNIISEDVLLRRLYCEAKLLLVNKLVILYRQGEQGLPEIITYNELLTLLQSSYKKYFLYSFHPINFKRVEEFRSYITGVREELFSEMT